jgi:hypothetical protein
MITVAMAAKAAGVHETLIDQWCRSGLLPHYRFRKGSGIILIDPDELDGFMAGYRQKSCPPVFLHEEGGL